VAPRARTPNRVRLGLAHNTIIAIIVFTSDHGYHMSEYRWLNSLSGDWIVNGRAVGGTDGCVHPN
jgi:hypothetical protein